MITLRPYQIRAVDDARKAIRSGKRRLIGSHEPPNISTDAVACLV